MAKLEMFDLAERIAIILQFENKSNMQDLRDLLSLLTALCNLGHLTCVVIGIEIGTSNLTIWHLSICKLNTELSSF